GATLPEGTLLQKISIPFDRNLQIATSRTHSASTNQALRSEVMNCGWTNVSGAETQGSEAFATCSGSFYPPRCASCRHILEEGQVTNAFLPLQADHLSL